MNRLYLTITLIVILSFVSFAQKSREQTSDRPDFTGAWVIEDKKSNPLKNHTLIINHAGDELILTESFEYKGKLISNKTTLYADQRGEQNPRLDPGADSAVEVRSKTSWKKSKLVRVSTFRTPFGASQGEVTWRETQTYSLSKDGNSLTVETSGNSEGPLSGGSLNTFYGKRAYQRKK